ncbi:MAG: M48 family metalloprotease [Chthonomonadales bacterium]
MSNYRRLILLPILAIFAVTILTGCAGGNLLSTKDEVRIGRRSAENIEHQVRVDASSDDAMRVRRIGERLVLHCDPRPGVPYSFKVIDINEVNAASLPGGPVYVYRGLLDLLGNDDDALACVIGHEIGHINGRHIAKQFTKQMEAGLLVGVLLQGKAPIAQELANAGLDLLSFKFSRDDETDADRRGISYAYKAGFDPVGMIHMFERLQSVEKRAGGAPPELLRNHPLTSARIDRVKKIIETQDYKFGK